jgi:hypothetical protein
MATESRSSNNLPMAAPVQVELTRGGEVTLAPAALPATSAGPTRADVFDGWRREFMDLMAEEADGESMDCLIKPIGSWPVSAAPMERTSGDRGRHHGQGHDGARGWRV